MSLGTRFIDTISRVFGLEEGGYVAPDPIAMLHPGEMWMTQSNAQLLFPEWVTCDECDLPQTLQLPDRTTIHVLAIDDPFWAANRMPPSGDKGGQP